jgi:small subunit ribosomal protein S9
VAVTQIQYYGTGRRKSAAARVFLRPGSGTIQINARPLVEALRVETLQCIVKVPLVLTETADKFDVIATTSGGGISGQAGAIRLGIARALCAYDIELRPRLKKAGLLTRDPRIKERKKYGMAGARKRFQFSKR